VPIRTNTPQHGVPDVFSIYLSPERAGSTLVLGGFDRRYFTGDMHYYPMSRTAPAARNGQYVVQFKDIMVAGKRMNVCPNEGCEGIVDSGTTALLGNEGS
jgi:hypothetical protein